MRRTVTTRLFEVEVDEQLICKVTGCCSIAVPANKRASRAEKEKVSDILKFQFTHSTTGTDDQDGQSKDSEPPKTKSQHPTTPNKTRDKGMTIG